MITDNKDKIILDLCGGTGSWSKPYKDAGYTVIIATLPDTDIMNWKSGEMLKISRLIEDNKIYGILSAPPCTEFSIARNDKTAKKKRDLMSGMKVVNQCLYIIHCTLARHHQKQHRRLKFWALENPASGYLTDFLGKPVLIFEPCDYGDPYTKKTALWGIFNEPHKNKVKATRGTMVKYASDFNDLKPVDEEYRKKLGIDSRTIRRSITPQGFAQAFFKANN